MSRPRIAYFYDADVGNFHYGELPFQMILKGLD